MGLPVYKTTDTVLTLLQSQWKRWLDPIIQNPALQSRILSKVVLASGSNTINHGLSQKLQGWKIVRQRAAATIYDTQDSNSSPALTLVLVSSAPVTVDIEVF